MVNELIVDDAARAASAPERATRIPVSQNVAVTWAAPSPEVDRYS